MQEIDIARRVVPFPKALKEYLGQTAKKARRTFVAEVVYRLEKVVEEERNAEKPASN